LPASCPQVDCVKIAYRTPIDCLFFMHRSIVELSPPLDWAVFTVRYFPKRTIEQFYTKHRQVGISDGQSIRWLGVFRAS
jgi:hypothetical protein